MILISDCGDLGGAVAGGTQTDNPVCYLFMPHMEEAVDINANLMGSKANVR